MRSSRRPVKPPGGHCLGGVVYVEAEPPVVQADLQVVVAGAVQGQVEFRLAPGQGRLTAQFHACGLLVLELVVNAITLFAALWWTVKQNRGWKRIALGAVAGTVIVHAVRVAVFVLGRTGPRADFDIRSERRAEYAAEVSWFSVWFAAAMAVTSVVVLVSVLRMGRKRRLVSGVD